MTSVSYISVGGDPSTDQQNANDILTKVKQGFKILSAVGTNGVVHYVLGKE